MNSGIRCRRNSVSECPPKWHRWGTKCYSVNTFAKVSQAQAKKRCERKGARLLSITSQEENDFISYLLASTGGSSLGFHSGGITFTIQEEQYWHWQGTESPSAKTLEFTKWWLGWGNVSNITEPDEITVKSILNATESQCIQLKHSFLLEKSSERRLSAKYYFWKNHLKCVIVATVRLNSTYWLVVPGSISDHVMAKPLKIFVQTSRTDSMVQLLQKGAVQSYSCCNHTFQMGLKEKLKSLGDCDKNLGFVCERDPLEIGCILGRGENYDGTANTTESGLPCLTWRSRRGSFRGLSQLKTLKENYCSNPDGDDLPWCYVAGGRTEFCDIPRCPYREPVEIENETSKCVSGSYSCKTGECIHLEWVCDGQKDCPQGEEEEDCPDYSDSFEKHSGFMLNGSGVEKWLFSPKPTCAIRCVQAKKFVCYSFNYEESTSTCILSKSNAGKSGGLVKDPNWEYHERIDLAPNCSISFICSDFKCIPKTKVCDGKRDCSTGEDEKDCTDLSNFEVRLVNGSGTQEGRVEIKVSGRWGPVCDDMWGIEDGNVVCRQLGYERGAKTTYTNSHFGNGDGEFLMDDLDCNGDEESLALCSFGGWGEDDCEINEAAGVSCYLDSDVCSSNQWQCKNGRCIHFAYYCDQIDDCGDSSDEHLDLCKSGIAVRLGFDASQGQGKSLNSSHASGQALEGRVEVRYRGLWGTICDDDISIEEGHVICRMLGWKGASHVFKNSSFGSGSGPIWIDGLKCLGNEVAVTECQHDRWGITNCDHSEDLGIRCTNDLSAEEKVKFSPVHPTVVIPVPYVFPSKCGIRYVDDIPKELLASPRVVDGYVPERGAQPWMAGLRRRTSVGSTHECGAFILSEDLLMTAAHCLWKYTISDYIIRTGDYHIEEEDVFEEEWLVDHILVHPMFDKGILFNNDVGLIKIKRKDGHGIRFNQRVQPLCLIDKGFTYAAGLNCTVAGWGTLSSSSGYSHILRSTLLPILPDSLCRAEHVYGPTRISSGMFCAGYMEGGVDTCQGDSGGPLVCQIEGRYTAVGITSWGHGCARANKPGVYTKLTYYLGWIYEVFKTINI